MEKNIETRLPNKKFNSIINFIKNNIGGLEIVLFFLILFFTVFNPTFLSKNNIFIVGRQASFIVIIALGQMFAILTAGIDLSVGSNVGLTSVVFAVVTLRFGLVTGILAGLFTGIFIGFINGEIISRCKIAAFIVTLGMLSVIRGLVLTVTSGQPVFGLPSIFRFLGTNDILGVPIPSLIAILMVFISYLILNKTKVGRYMYAIGGNMEAARLSGINIKNVLLFAYCYCGLMAGLYSIIMSSRVNSGQPNLGSGLELTAIGAVVIGGTSLSGGKGSVKGVVIGAIIVTIISNGLNLLKVSSFTQMMINGLIIIIAVIIGEKKSQ